MDLQHNLYDIYDIFQKNGLLLIPKYQRGYAWTTENFAEFWEDIRIHIIENNEPHFFGSLIFANKPDEQMLRYSEIIDGQQRLTTFTIFFRALYDLCPDDNGIKTQIYRKIISADNEETYRLTLGDIDEEFFRTYIKQKVPNRDRKGKLTSHKLIRTGYEHFTSEIKKYIEISNYNINELVNTLFERFETQTQFLLLKVPSDADAYVIFESINAKRVDLTPAELLKNYFFSNANSVSSTALSLVQSYWSTINDNLSQFDNTPELTTFIRHYWISAYEDTQEKSLYKTIKTGTHSSFKDIERLMLGLLNAASDYALMNNISNSQSSSGLALSSFKKIAKLNYKQAYPLMLSLLSSNISQDIFDMTIDRLTSVFIRRSIVRANPNELEKTLSVSARNIREGLEKGLENLEKELKRLNPDNEEVIKALTSRGDASIARFILHEYEISLAAVGGKVIDKPTIEHIMPQKPEALSDWGVTEDEHIDWVQNIGNLTLLEHPINSSVKNKKYSIKIKEYEKQATDMNTTKEVVNEYKSWGVKSIKSRSERLSNFVINKWQ